MLNKIKWTFNVLAALLITFIFTTNVVFSENVKEIPTVNGIFGQTIMLFGFFGLIYFLILRPQTKRAKEHKALIDGLTIGDEIITIGGLLGKVQNIVDHFIILTVANNVQVTIQKQAIAQILPKDSIQNIHKPV